MTYGIHTHLRSKRGNRITVYLSADSIADAERRARMWGIFGDGFELTEVIDG